MKPGTYGNCRVNYMQDSMTNQILPPCKIAHKRTIDRVICYKKPRTRQENNYCNLLLLFVIKREQVFSFYIVVKTPADISITRLLSADGDY